MLPRALGLALAAVIALATPAQAGTWLDPALPFGHTSFQPGEAGVGMGPDGTIVIARVAPDGNVEVRERPPGGPVGDTVTLEPVTAPPRASTLQVLVGEYGTAAVLFDVGLARYAALRQPGGRWTRPDVVSLAGSRQAAVAPDGALWVVGPDPGDPDELGVSRMTPDGHATLTPLPAPEGAARDVFPMITVPAPGEAHVTFQRELTEAGQGACRRQAIDFAIDVPARGAPGAPQPLANVRAAGTGTAGNCALDEGFTLQSPRLGTDDDGADTAAYSVLDEHSGLVTVLARHRAPGEAWGQTETVTDQDVVAETLIGGRGTPAVVLRTGEGASVSVLAGGAWTPPAPLADEDGLASPIGARTGAGTIAFAWVEGPHGADPAHVQARVLGADGRLGEPRTLAEGDLGPVVLGVGGDEDGDAVALYSQPGNLLQMSGYDGAGPEITALSVPRAGFAGQGLPFAVEGFDVWSGPADAATWRFGDGQTAHGVAVGHAYDQAGGYTVQVELADAVGHTTSASRDVAIAGLDPLPAPTIPPPDRHPRLTHLALDPRHPRANRAAVLTLRSDLAGELRITLKRRGGRRTVTIRRLIRTGKVRVKLPRLAAGTWTLTAAEADVQARLRFSVRRAARPRP
jgi:hypothetical protein